MQASIFAPSQATPKGITCSICHLTAKLGQPIITHTVWNEQVYMIHMVCAEQRVYKQTGRVEKMLDKINEKVAKFGLTVDQIRDIIGFTEGEHMTKDEIVESVEKLTKEFKDA